MLSTSHLHQTLSLPTTLLPDSKVYFSIQDAMMENSFTIISTSLPGAITEHSYDSLIPTRDFQLNRKWDTKPMQWLALQTSVLNQMLCLLQQPRSQKTQCPAQPQCKMKHKQMTFLQHVHLHKARVAPLCPVNMSGCTAPLTKLSGQIRGGLLKTADRS